MAKLQTPPNAETEKSRFQGWVRDLWKRVTGAVGGTDNAVLKIDENGNYVESDLSVRDGGSMINKGGLITTAAQYGSGLWVWTFGDDTAEHTNQVGSYDHTGGAYENLFTKTSGADFTQADADNGNWFLLLGDNIGAVCEVKEFIDANNVIVDGMGWDTDLASQRFFTYKHPSIVVGDGYKHEFSVGADGEFEIAGYDFTGSKMIEFELDSAADGTDCAVIEANANGYSNVQGLIIDYHSGAITAGESGGGMGIRLDLSNAGAIDSTTLITSYIAAVAAGGDATTTAYGVLPGYTNALSVFGASEEDPDYGYSNVLTVSTDRVTGVAPDGTAFLESSATNITIFSNDDDYILIGSDSTFEIIEAILATTSSKDIEADYFYSKAGGNWTALTIKSDGTSGFQGSGSISFDAPVDWTKDDEDLDGNAITDAYYIAIQRTRGAAIVTLPVEDYFKIFESTETGMKIDGQGFIEPRSAADADAPNNRIYYSTTQSKLVFKDSGGTVNDLY